MCRAWMDGTSRTTCWQLLELGDGDMGLHQTFLSTFEVSPPPQFFLNRFSLQIIWDAEKRFVVAGEEVIPSSKKKTLPDWKGELL